LSAKDSPTFRRLRFALVAVLSAVSLTACSKVDLMTGLEEGDAVDMIVLLRQNGISAQKLGVGTGQDVLWSVSVGPRDASNAFLVLAENDQPRPSPKGFADFFGKSKLIPTETEERAIFLQAQAGELEQTLESMPSVIDARVHISIPQHDALRELVEGTPPPQPTAAIFVKHWAPKPDTPNESKITRSDVQTLVAGSIERLAPEQVQVVLKSVSPVTTPVVSEPLDPTLLFYPLAGLTLLLVALLIFLSLRNRSLSRQIDEFASRRAKKRAEA